MRLGLFVLLALPAGAAGFLFTEVTINGAGPFRLLVDTGATSTKLSPDAARAAGLQPAYAVQLTALAGETLVPAAVARAIVHGHSAAGDFEILIAAPSAVRTVDAKADGVLGQSFLSRIPWMIDYRNRRLVMGESAILISRTMPELACRREADARLILTLAIGPASFNVALDSGASHLILHCAPDCPRFETPGASRTILTNAEAAPATLGSIRDVIAALLALKRADAVLNESPPLAPSIHGVLPASWFKAVFADPRESSVRNAS